VVSRAADGSGPAEGTRVAAYPEWEGWAERVPVPATAVAALDDRVSFEEAATLPVAGLTALRALREGGAVLGRNVPGPVDDATYAVAAPDPEMIQVGDAVWQRP
jgi:NADPH:quinone reductase